MDTMTKIERDLERLRLAGIHPVRGGTEAPAADDKSGLASDGDVSENPEFITDPDTGRRIRTEDVFEMRRESTQRFQQASEREKKANDALDRVFKGIGRNEESAEATAPEAPAERINLDDVDLVGDDGLKELGKRLNLGVNATKDEIIQEIERREQEQDRRIDEKLDEREMRTAVHQENLATLDAYLEEVDMPKARREELRGEFIEHLKGLPRSARYVTKGPDGYLRFTKNAMRAADMAIRGDEVVKAAESRAADEARRKVIEDSDADWDAGGGGGGGDVVSGDAFRAMSPAEQEQFIEGFPNTDAKLDWLERNLSVDETIAVVQRGAREQINRSRGGYPRAALA